MASKLDLTTGIVYLKGGSGGYTSFSALQLAAGSASAPSIITTDADSGIYTSANGASWYGVVNQVGHWGITGDGCEVYTLKFSTGVGGGPGEHRIALIHQAHASIYGLAVESGDNTAHRMLAAGSVQLQGAAPTGQLSGAASSARKLIKTVTGIADNSATAVFTVTVPNANHAAGIRLFFLSSNGSTDAFESSRVATGFVVLARTTGANVVAAAAAIADAQIATVSGGATHTLAYGVSAITGAVGDSNTFDITVTIDDSGNTGSNQVVVVAELINSEASGVTIA